MKGHDEQQPDRQDHHPPPTRKVQEVSDGICAYVQPDGSERMVSNPTFIRLVRSQVSGRTLYP